MNDRPATDWVQENRNAAAREAALAIAMPPPEPLQTVAYTSGGKTLVIGSPELALQCAERLAGALPITVLLTSGGSAPLRAYQTWACSEVEVNGWLGAFEARWTDAGRSMLQHEGRFDLVLDLSGTPLISAHQKPHGYFAPGHDQAAISGAIGQLIEMIGDFEKPKYFRYKERLCAHGRNRKVGCTSCIDICSAKAIESADDRIRVNPYLCAGCGACTTVCPSGALAYAYPGAPYTGERLRGMLATYLGEGGLDPVVLFYGEGQGTALVAGLDGDSAAGLGLHGLPTRAIPMQLHHMAATGIDVWLSAIAYGAAGVSVLVTDADAPQYAEALAGQMDIAQAILTGLGYAGTHFQLIRASSAARLDEALLSAPAGVAR